MVCLGVPYFRVCGLNCLTFPGLSFIKTTFLLWQDLIVSKRGERGYPLLLLGISFYGDTEVQRAGALHAASNLCACTRKRSLIDLVKTRMGRVYDGEDVPGITMNLLCTDKSYNKMYRTESRYNDENLANRT